MFKIKYWKNGEWVEEMREDVEGVVYVNKNGEVMKVWLKGKDDDEYWVGKLMRKVKK